MNNGLVIKHRMGWAIIFVKLCKDGWVKKNLFIVGGLCIIIIIIIIIIEA